VANRLCKYVIQTEEPQLTPVDAVTIYKDLSEVECAFALAFLLHRAIEKKLKAARLDLSATEDAGRDASRWSSRRSRGGSGERDPERDTSGICRGPAPPPRTSTCSGTTLITTTAHSGLLPRCA
jgi:hypothetical protein